MFIPRFVSPRRAPSTTALINQPIEPLERRLLMADHDLDPSFGENATGMFTTGFGSSIVDQFAYTIAQQGDGKLLVGGRAANGAGQSLASVMRLRTDGSLDNTFGGDGKSSIILKLVNPNDRGDMTVLGNGNVVLATSAESFDPSDPNPTFSRMTLVFFKPDGALNTEFHTNGILQPNFGAGAEEVSARAVALLPNGRILIAGHTIGSSGPAIVLARLMSTGLFDSTFGNNGVLIRPFTGKTVRVHDMAIDPQGRAVIVGSENNEFLAARFTTTGAFDSSFNGDGLAVQSFGPNADEARAVVIQPDGDIVVGGVTFNETGSRSDFAAMRLNNDGFLDRSFGDTGLVHIGIDKKTTIKSVGFETDGQLAFAGDTAPTSRAADVRPVIIHLNADGSRDAAFGDNGVLRFDTGSSGFNSIVVQENGKLAMAGARSNGNQDLWFTARLGRGPFENGTDGNLYVTGTDADEDIRVVTDGTKVRILIDDTFATSRARSTFTRLNVDGAAGDDTITLEATGRFDIFGGSGNDTVNGSAGTEFISGGRGNDVLFGNEGLDRMEDGLDDDQVFGGPGEDTIVISSGNDTVNGGGEADKITASGSTGSKRINGEGGNDTITGGEDDDFLNGSGGRDRLYGRGGNDRLDGNDRGDFLDGGPNNDNLNGGDGEDELVGGSGIDKMYGGHDADVLNGNSGDDQLNDIDGFADILGGGSGTDIAFRDEDLDDLSSIEVIG